MIDQIGNSKKKSTPLPSSPLRTRALQCLLKARIYQLFKRQDSLNFHQAISSLMTEIALIVMFELA